MGGCGHLELPFDDRHLRFKGLEQLVLFTKGRDQVLRRFSVGTEIRMEGRPAALVIPQRFLLLDELAELASLVGQPFGRVSKHHTTDLAENWQLVGEPRSGPPDCILIAPEATVIVTSTPGSAVSRTSSATRTKGAATASMLLRMTVGPTLVFHGYSKIFGGGGLGGTARYFEALGLRPGTLHAGLGAGTEIGAGALMTVGALSPLPAAGAIGLMATAARTDHKDKGFLVFKGG